MENLKQRSLIAMAWDLGGNAAAQTVTLLAAVVLARLLEPSDFGLVALSTAMIGFSRVIVDGGLGQALIQRSAVEREHILSALTFNLAASVILCVIIFAAAPAVAAFYELPLLTDITRIMGIAFVAHAAGAVPTALLQRELRFKVIAKARFVAAVAATTCGLIMAFQGYGVWSLVALSIVQIAVHNFVIWKSADWRPAIGFERKAFLELWSFGSRIFVSRLLDAIFLRLDYLVIGKLFSATSLGFYQRARSLNLMVVNQVASSMYATLFPALSKLQDDTVRFTRVFARLTGLGALSGTLLAGCLAVAAEPLILLLFGAKWAPSVAYFELLAISALVWPLGTLLNNALQSRGNAGAALRLEVAKKCVVLGNFVVAFSIGDIRTFLIGTIVVGAINTIMGCFFASRELGCKVLMLIIPILRQVAIGALSLALTVYLQAESLPLILKLLINPGLFALLFLTINLLLRSTELASAREDLTRFISRSGSAAL